MSAYLVKRVAIGTILLGPVVARADQRDELATTRSEIGWGQSVNPDRVCMWTEGGWDGAAHRTEVDATVEATVFDRASVFATAELGGVSTTARPAFGAAYQLVDPRSGTRGARVSVAYKPEGFTEPEGELESVLVVSQRLGGDVVRARLAYGQDPEGRESDAELGGSYLHRVGSSVELGASSRYRHAIKVKTLAEPRWDLIGGLVGAYVLGRSRIEVLVGVDSLAYGTDPAKAGIVGLVSVGTEL